MPHTLTWQEQGQTHQAEWRHTAAQKPPAELAVAEPNLSAKAALKNFRQSQALLWRGDYHQAVQLLSAVKRQLPAAASPDFHTHRMQQAQRSRLANMLLVEISPGYRLALRRAPDVSAALADVFGAPNSEPFLLPLNLLLGFIGAHQWHKKGVEIPALGARIHVPFGVFSPLRGEYLDLIAAAPLPPHAQSAFDIGTGSGVIAALLAQRGLPAITATDNSPRAIACARANFQRLGLPHITLLQADLFPESRADLIVCNPPWLPAKPAADIETALYDPGSTMLQTFLRRAPEHLNPGGQIWLIMSDLAEHLGLRRPGELAEHIAAAGLTVAQRLDTRPQHPKSRDAANPLAHARLRETVSLYVLQPAQAS
ncbi:class I SAM-dependent methyltransferase [Eikenella sp. Marseille-P7795]|uniref:methyltransferase n=1 Tax=Eikenella sp. Marseille-P7795 TaxID=2866577 RepID=UPI001CE40D41|nr:class I SAM-dependent methyltransferase [Eikenella sp. Marseille-P7795]